ncbi:hypothetical protein BVRB_9g211430 isoform B [Beta vulgaris subsp. vulgaris]|nr:hypothetical protein BVRB_9g211430 isoform B [Beta vulgaris subsp. vulgaris]
MLGKFLLLNLILSTNGLRKAGFKLVIFWDNSSISYVYKSPYF